MEKWQERLIPGQAGIKELGQDAAAAQAEEVARRTRYLLATRGWCLWKCNVLGGDIIAVVLDETVDGVPEEYPVYTAEELGELCQDSVSEATLRLVHEAKKLAGAKVTTKVTNIEGGS
jgi:hypothetical protein